MAEIDRIHLEHPFYDSRRLRDGIGNWGFCVVNRKRAQRLMRIMGLAALSPRSRTLAPGMGYKIDPYRLPGLTIDRSNQAWAVGICYITMACGFMYLVPSMDWHARRVLSWRVSHAMGADFCVDSLQEAISRFGCLGIFNTDQSTQFTLEAFTNVLKDHDITISMDGEGRWGDNVFVEHLWRTVEYENVYLKAYETPRELEQ